MDPRTGMIENRLKGTRVIAVSGGKGGIGKSLASSVMALELSNMGYKVGLLDLDFSSPSDHVILGFDYSKHKPEEDMGLVPPEICGVKFFSLVFYAGENPSPLRGIDVSNAIREILSIVKWGNLDILLIDMPPGIGEATLDSIRLIKNIEFLVLTTPSKVSTDSVKKFVRLLKELKMPVIGVIENMRISESSKDDFDNFLGSIKFDLDLEKALGNPEKLLKTKFSQEFREILKKIF